MTAPRGRPRRLKGSLRGWRYPGEVVRAGAWHPGLSALSQGALFRIVLFPSPRPLSPEAVSDPCLAFLIHPPGHPSRTGRTREAPAPYSVSATDASGAVFTIRPQGGALPAAAAPMGPQEVAGHLLDWWELAEWDRHLPLLRLLAPGLTTASTPGEVADQEAGLLKVVADLQQNVTRLGLRLRALYDTWNEPMDEAVGILERLSSLGSAAFSPAGGPLGLCLALGAAYPSSEALELDLDFLDRAGLLESHLPIVLSTSRYLLAASPGEGELALDRVSLMQRMAPAPLLEDPNLWPSLHPMFTWFQGRYRAFYTDFHRKHHREASRLRAEMEKALPRLEALRQLNSITELGLAVEAGLEAEYQDVLSDLAPCTQEELPPEAPLCPGCGLRPPVQPPSSRVDDLLHRLDMALTQQQARLSSQAVRQILQSGGPRLEQFLKVLRAGDPSPLVSVLDDEVVAFLHQLLAEGQWVTVKSSAITSLLREFSHLEEAQIDQVLARLNTELRQTFESAQRQHPGKRIRLTWEP